MPEEPHRVRDQLAALSEALHLQGQKLDFLVNTVVEERTERRQSCDRHGSRITALEIWRTGIVAGGVVAFAIMWEKVKKTLGI